MNTPLPVILTTFLFISHNVMAGSISQCVQPDGTIEFTNQGCSKSNRLQSRQSYSRNSTQSLVTKGKEKRKRSAAFLQPTFVQLQKKLISAETLEDIEAHAQTITDKVNSHAQRGKISTAYNMVAATYVKLSKYMKKRQWDGQSIEAHIPDIRTLFEEILITQSTTSSTIEFNRAIENAWLNYQKNT